MQNSSLDLSTVEVSGSYDESPGAPGGSASEAAGAALEGDGAVADSGCVLPDGPRTFDERKGPPAALAGGCVPEVEPEQLAAAFAAIRDTRMLAMVERPDFPRRIPWLLADNGCEERAGAVAYYLHQWGYPTPYFARVKAKKGKSLVLQTENDPSGVVKWSGHVAGVVRVGRELMILDPAIEPTQPVRIAQWLARQTKSLDDIDVALCRDYPVGDSCFAATPVEPSPPETDAGGAMQSRLLTEWRVQEILGRDPLRTLGDCPPWASCLQPEPVADPSLPPVIGRFASNQFEDDVYVPFFIIGNNFVDGLTTVRIVGNQIDQLAMTESCMLRRILVVDDYPPGDYVVTAFNGQLASQSVPLTIH